jgi:hypothetical protein
MPEGQTAQRAYVRLVCGYRHRMQAIPGVNFFMEPSIAPLVGHTSENFLPIRAGHIRACRIGTPRVTLSL